MSTAVAEITAMPIRVILVDDEPLMRQHLCERLAAHPEIMIVGEADGVQFASDLVATAKPDAIFLDVQMSPDNGFDLLPMLETIQPRPAVVFVTAYDQYALKAFEIHALDYLTKPVNPARLAKTVERLVQSITAQRRSANVQENRDHSTADLSEAPLEPLDLIPLRDGAHIRMVEVGQITAVKVDGDYSHVIVAGGKAAMIKNNLSQWEKKLPPSLFIRISRRLLVNRRQIQQIVPLSREKTQVFLKGITEPLLLSRIELRRLKTVL